MKYKMTAVLVALAMMFAGVFVMADGDGADADSPSTSIIIAQGGTYTTTFLLNDNAYGTYTETYVWKVNDGSTDAELTKDASAEKYSNSTAVSGLTYTVEKGNGGVYTLTIKAADNAAAGTYNHTLKCVVTVTVKDGSSVALKEFDYSLSIKITSNSSGVSIADISLEKGKAGVSQAIIPTGIALGEYDWYAIGLPAGLGMSKDGTISGVVLGEAKEYTCKVTAFTKNTEVTTVMPMAYYAIEMKVTVTAPVGKSVDLSFTFDGDGKILDDTATPGDKMTFSNIGFGLTPTVSPSGTVIAEQGEKVTFTVGDGFTVSSVTSVKATIGEAETLTESSGYTPDTSGVGSYKVIIKGSVDNTEVTLTFNLLVLASTQGDWAPAIVINGN